MWLFNREIRFATRSPDWKKTRQKHLEEHPCCASCGSCTKPEVHHIIPVHIDPSKELDTDNLITLCDKHCHFVFGHFMNYRSWNPNVVKDTSKYYKDKKDSRK